MLLSEASASQANIILRVSGARGMSNYALWLSNGNAGTLDDYLAFAESELTPIRDEVLDAVSAIRNRTFIMGDRDPFIEDFSTQTGTAITFLLGDPIPHSGAIKEVALNMGLGGGTLRVRLFEKTGTDYDRIGADTVFALANGVNVFATDIAVEAGQYLGYYVSAGLNRSSAPFLTVPGPLLGGDAGDITHFANPAFNTTVKDQIRFTAEYAAPVGEASTEDRIVDAAATFSNLTFSMSATFERNGAVREVTYAPAARAAPVNVRYDVVYYDVEAAAFGITAGTDRSDAAEFIPAMTDSKRQPVFNLRVTPGGITAAVPVWDVFDGEHRSLSEMLERERRRSRRCLPKTLAKIHSGAPLAITGTGDSIAEIRADVGPSSAAVPNGVPRDRASNGAQPRYLSASIGADVQAALPLYTAVQLGRADDGAGQVHSRMGFIWYGVVEPLEARGLHSLQAGTLDYNNFAIAGTQTSDFVVAGVLTAWGAAVAALPGDLVIVNFGMNELGNVNTEARLVSIGQLLKAAGKEVIFMGVAHINPGFGGGPQPSVTWEYTNRAIERAARFTGCAYVPFMPLYDERYIGAIGLAVEDACYANGNNHPGILEHKAIGRELAKLLFGDG